jgi:transposase
MIIPPTGVEYWLVSGATDMRQGPYKLSEFVRSQVGDDELYGHWFVFCNRAEDQIRSIWWDHHGRIHLYSIRATHGKFIWPQEATGAISLSWPQVKLLLNGADWTVAPRLRPGLNHDPTAMLAGRHRHAPPPSQLDQV